MLTSLLTSLIVCTRQAAATDAKYLYGGERAPFDGRLIPDRQFESMMKDLNRLPICKSELDQCMSTQMPMDYPRLDEGSWESAIKGFAFGFAAAVLVDKYVGGK